MCACWLMIKMTNFQITILRQVFGTGNRFPPVVPRNLTEAGLELIPGHRQKANACMTAMRQSVFLWRGDCPNRGDLQLGHVLTSCTETQTGFFALVEGSNEYRKLALPLLWGSVHQIQGCPLGHLGVRSRDLYPQSVGSKGWKLTLLGIRIERPVSRTDKSFQQDAVGCCDRSSMD